MAQVFWPHSSLNMNECWLAQKYMHPCRAGATDVVAYLVNDCNCSTQEENDDGLLPLHLACTQSLEIVETVLNGFTEEYLASVLVSGKITPFEMACSFGRLDIVKGACMFGPINIHSY